METSFNSFTKAFQQAIVQLLLFYVYIYIYIKVIVTIYIYIFFFACRSDIQFQLFVCFIEVFRIYFQFLVNKVSLQDPSVFRKKLACV